MVYRHTTALRAVDVQDSAAITLMGTDVERIVQALRFIHEVWASIPEIAVAVWLLARQMSYAALMPLVVALGQSEDSFVQISVNPANTISSIRSWSIIRRGAVWPCPKGVERAR